MPLADGPPPTPPAQTAQAAPAFDLATLAPPEPAPDLSAVHPRCAAAVRRDEIVVCAEDPSANRLGEPSGLNGYTAPRDTPPRAAWTLGDTVAMDLHMESEAMPNGVVSNRLMVGAKIAF